MIEPDKLQTLTEYLRQGECQIILDARQGGVSVPAAYTDKQDLKLNLSFRYDPPDLKLSAWGISITLSFDGERHPVRIPWDAIYGARSTAGAVMWAEPPAPVAVTKRRGGLGLVN